MSQEIEKFDPSTLMQGVKDRIKLKRCPKCNQELDVSNFCKDGSRSSGIYHTCKTCVCKYHKTHNARPEIRAKNIIKSKQYYQSPEGREIKRSYHKRPEVLEAARIRSRRPEIKLKAKSRLLKKFYGLTMEEYFEILEKQNNSCAICGIEVKPFVKTTHIDHCHKTNKIRGILCHYCNTGIGSLKDSVAILKKAIEYIEVNL